MSTSILLLVVTALTMLGCKKKEDASEQAKTFRVTSVTVDDVNQGFTYTGTRLQPVVRIAFSEAPDESTSRSAISFKAVPSADVPCTATIENNNTLVVKPENSLAGLSKYTIVVSDKLLAASGAKLQSSVNVTLTTGIDSTDKFARISDDDLLTLVQRQTFKYFWDFAHPVSGMARERNTSGDVVTSGGTGFGIMAVVAAAHRGFISREEALTHLQKMVSFLKNDAQTFHGAYSHWLNGTSGESIPFSQMDNGADLVETSYLIQGLLTARQYFNGSSVQESSFRDDVNEIWNNVEWDWFRQNGQEVLYWHWSPEYEWQMNHAIRGWNECLITYVLAASSTTHTIPKSVYDNGWAQQGNMANNSTYYGIQLPLGPPYGGPLFFSHYSFLGINPHDLQDAYANYWTQNVAHALINYNYCVENPDKHAGYSSAVWGLTASDNNNGYSAHSPDNDLGVISPTAALSSFPYTPEQSMEALKFFYYKLGDRIWKDYGFVDAFNLDVPWFADSFLAIDQGPIIVMMENYRSGLLWDLFMSCPEVKTGMNKLGFQSPDL